MKNILITAFFLFCHLWSLGQTPKTPLQLEVFYNPQAYFYRNQPSEFIRSQKWNQINTFNQESFGMRLGFYAQKSYLYVKTGLSFSRQNYSIGNELGFSETLTALLAATLDGNINLPEETLKRVNLQADYLNIPVNLQFRFNENPENKFRPYVAGQLTPGILVNSKAKFVFFENVNSNIDLHDLEAAYTQPIKKLNLQISLLTGFEWEFAKKSSIILDFQFFNRFFNSPNAAIIRKPWGFGINFGLSREIN